jgi:aminoglycoside phosphotransferase (APT) family kinase protein
MRPEWSPDIGVSPELACMLIEAQFPALVPAHVEPLGAGWDNTAYQINEMYVFRFPRRQLVIRCLEMEARLMPALGPRLPLPVPIPEFLGTPSEVFPWPFLGHRKIPGRTACTVHLDDTQRTQLAEPLARFLKALHTIPADEAARLGAGSDPFQRLDMAPRLSRARTTLDELVQRGILDNLKPLWCLLNAAPALYSARANTLVHGDLYARQLLLDSEGQVSGIIDWGDVHLGNPAVDFALAHSFLPAQAHAEFRQAYGRIDEPTWQLARARAVWHTLNLTLYADSIGDADLIRECRCALGFLSSEESATDVHR